MKSNADSIKQLISEIETKPCPFCGGEADPAGWYSQDGKRGPECEDCGATARSVAEWNHRHNEVDEAIKRFQIMVETIDYLHDELCDDCTTADEMRERMVNYSVLLEQNKSYIQSIKRVLQEK